MAFASFKSPIGVEVACALMYLISSNAIPALYFPRCIDLLEAAMVDVKSLISHRFKLEDLPTAMAQYLAEKDKAVKAIMVNE